MPDFSAYEVNFTAKGKCCSDGEIYTVDSSNGHTVPVIPSTYTAFKGVPVRSGTGVWSVTTRLYGFRVTNMVVKTMTSTANALDVIYQAPTTDSTGLTVLNWTFCTLGTATPADLAASQKFMVAVEASGIFGALMPLKQSKSKAAFSGNIKELRAAGHSMKQSLAIAYNVKRHPKPKGGR